MYVEMCEFWMHDLEEATNHPAQALGWLNKVSGTGEREPEPTLKSRFWEEKQGHHVVSEPTGLPIQCEKL